jgi:hypothetical protein
MLSARKSAKIPLAEQPGLIETGLDQRRLFLLCKRIGQREMIGEHHLEHGERAFAFGMLGIVSRTSRVHSETIPIVLCGSEASASLSLPRVKTV